MAKIPGIRERVHQPLRTSAERPSAPSTIREALNRMDRATVAWQQICLAPASHHSDEERRRAAAESFAARTACEDEIALQISLASLDRERIKGLAVDAEALYENALVLAEAVRDPSFNLTPAESFKMLNDLSELRNSARKALQDIREDCRREPGEIAGGRSPDGRLLSGSESSRPSPDVLERQRQLNAERASVGLEPIAEDGIDGPRTRQAEQELAARPQGLDAFKLDGEE